MGDIKSTLDLVMEKTKHFSLTREERALQQRDDLKKRLKGLLQKYQDELISVEQFKTRYEKLKAEFKLSENAVVIEAVFDQLGIERDNRVMIHLLQELCDLDATPIRSIIDDCRQALQRAAEKRQSELALALAREKCISGSAVVPNLEVDEGWQLLQGKIRTEFEQRLGQEKDSLII